MERQGIARSLKQTSFSGIVSQCPSMRQIFSLLEKVAKTPSTVLILGESGTGKELIARAVHKLSGRQGPLVPVNCGAIPEDILESELFGHEKGAFTGATGTRMGRFQLADHGTIFLDEIGDMSPKLQVKLLRVLQERKIDPVGSSRSIEVNVRVIAATHKDLREEVRQGRFREDLYYRLQVVPVELPPLRVREGDISLLAELFMDRFCASFGRSPVTIGDDALTALQSYRWPGNIRELENLIERLAIVVDGDEVTVGDLPHYITGSSIESPSITQLVEVEHIPSGGLDFNQMVHDLEVRLISLALQRTGGNKKAAARLLNLNRTTLVEKIRKKGLDKDVEWGSDSESELELAPSFSFR